MKVKSDGLLSESIQTTEGFFQGEVFSLLLLSLYIRNIVTFLKEKATEGLFVDHRDILLLMYADDILLLALIEAKLRRSLKLLEEYCDINGSDADCSFVL